jgi:hypothetical protein
LAKLEEERKKFVEKELELRRSALVEAKPEGAKPDARAEGEQAKDADPKAGGADAK